MSRKWLAGLVGLLFAAIAVGVWKTQFDEQRPIDPAPLNKYRETFVAKYRREECLVRIDFTYKERWSDKLNERVFRNLVRFIAEERPQTGGFWWTLNPATGQIFVQISDDCPRRYDHMRDWAASFARRYDNPRFTVSDDHIKPGPDTLDHQTEDWLD